MHARLFRRALAAAVIKTPAAPAYVRAGPPVSPVRYPAARRRAAVATGAGRGASAAAPPGTRTHPVGRAGTPASSCGNRATTA
jgi:hypothetical protein